MFSDIIATLVLYRVSGFIGSQIFGKLVSNCCLVKSCSCYTYSSINILKYCYIAIFSAAMQYNMADL